MKKIFITLAAVSLLTAVGAHANEDTGAVLCEASTVAGCTTIMNQICTLQEEIVEFQNELDDVSGVCEDQKEQCADSCPEGTRHYEECVAGLTSCNSVDWLNNRISSNQSRISELEESFNACEAAGTPKNGGLELGGKSKRLRSGVTKRSTKRSNSRSGRSSRQSRGSRR